MYEMLSLQCLFLTYQFIGIVRHPELHPLAVDQREFLDNAVLQVIVDESLPRDLPYVQFE